MTKLFYGSYAICALLALLMLAMFFSAYLHGDLAIYNGVILFTSSATSSILLASIFFSLKVKVIAQLLFAVSAIYAYSWDMIIWPVDSARLSFSDGLFHGLLFLIFIFVPIMGLVSGTSLLRQHAEREE